MQTLVEGASSRGFVSGHRLEMVALVLCALMLSIGFLLGPLGLPRPTFPDENQYSTMVDVLRGDASFEDVEAPFRARVLVPALASILPFDADTSFLVWNAFFALAAGLAAVWYLRSLGFDDKSALLGVALFAISFPYVFYGPRVLTDIAGMFFVFLALAMTVRGSNIAAVIAVITLGALTRETTLIVLPALYIHRRYGLGQKDLAKYALGIVPIAVLVAVRTVVSSDGGSDVGYIWQPSLDSVRFNLENVFGTGELSVWLSIIPLLPFVLVLLARPGIERAGPGLSKRLFLPLSVLILLVMLYGLSAAYFDGRFILLSYAVLIPLAVRGYSRWDGLPVLGSLKKILDRVLRWLT